MDNTGQVPLTYTMAELDQREREAMERCAAILDREIADNPFDGTIETINYRAGLRMLASEMRRGGKP